MNGFETQNVQVVPERDLRVGVELEAVAPTTIKGPRPPPRHAEPKPHAPQPAREILDPFAGQ